MGPFWGVGINFYKCLEGKERLEAKKYDRIVIFDFDSSETHRFSFEVNNIFATAAVLV